MRRPPLVLALVLAVVHLGSRAASPQVTFIPAAQVTAAFDKGIPLLQTDAYQIHASRSEAPGMAEIHTRDTDIIYVQEGTATIVTGGEAVRPEPIAAIAAAVGGGALLAAPGAVGSTGVTVTHTTLGGTGGTTALPGPGGVNVVGPAGGSITTTGGPNVSIVGSDASVAISNRTSAMIDIAQVQGQVHAQSVQKVGELADKNPNETVSILRTWLHENAA